MSMYCPQCSNQYSEAHVPVQFTCCATQICRRCAFFGWVNNNKRCWNKKCSHRGKLRIRNTGKVQDKSKLKDDEKEIVLLNPEEFFQQESLFSEEPFKECSCENDEVQSPQDTDHGAVIIISSGESSEDDELHDIDTCNIRMTESTDSGNGTTEENEKSSRRRRSGHTKSKRKKPCESEQDNEMQPRARTRRKTMIFNSSDDESIPDSLYSSHFKSTHQNSSSDTPDTHLPSSMSISSNSSDPSVPAEGEHNEETAIEDLIDSADDHSEEICEIYPVNTSFDDVFAKHPDLVRGLANTFVDGAGGDDCILSDLVKEITKRSDNDPGKVISAEVNENAQLTPSQRDKESNYELDHYKKQGSDDPTNNEVVYCDNMEPNLSSTTNPDDAEDEEGLQSQSELVQEKGAGCKSPDSLNKDAEQYQESNSYYQPTLAEDQPITSDDIHISEDPAYDNQERQDEDTIRIIVKSVGFDLQAIIKSEINAVEISNTMDADLQTKRSHFEKSKLGHPIKEKVEPAPQEYVENVSQVPDPVNTKYESKKEAVERNQLLKEEASNKSSPPKEEKVPELPSSDVIDIVPLAIPQCTCATWSSPRDPSCRVCMNAFRPLRVKVIGVMNNILLGEITDEDGYLNGKRFVKYITHFYMDNTGELLDTTVSSKFKNPFGQVCLLYDLQEMGKKLILMSLPHSSKKPLPSKGDYLSGTCQAFLDITVNDSERTYKQSNCLINDDGSFHLTCQPFDFSHMSSRTFVQVVTVNENLMVNEEDSFVSLDETGEFHLLCKKNPDKLGYFPQPGEIIGDISTQVPLETVKRLIKRIKNPPPLSPNPIPASPPILPPVLNPSIKACPIPPSVNQNSNMGTIRKRNKKPFQMSLSRIAPRQLDPLVRKVFNTAEEDEEDINHKNNKKPELTKLNVSLPKPVPAGRCPQCTTVPPTGQQYKKCLEFCSSCKLYGLQIIHPIQLPPNTPLHVMVKLNSVIKYKCVKILTRNGLLEVPQVLGAKKTQVILKRAEDNGEIRVLVINLSPDHRILSKGEILGEAQIVHD